MIDTIVGSWKPLSIFAKSSILDVWLGSEYASVYSSLHNKDIVAEVNNYFRESFISDVWQGSEYTSEVSHFVLLVSLFILIWTGKCQMEIKIPFG